MSLKITNLAYQNDVPCKHFKITIDDNGDVHDIEWAKHEDELVQLAKDVRNFMGLGEDQEEEALLILWAIVMLYRRGKTKEEVKGFDIDAV